MYELVQVAENTFYINCPSKIGVYRTSATTVILIDSGNDKDAGRKVQKILEGENWSLEAIINTHSNADHIGGNTLLQNRLHCPVYSTPMENTIIEHPIIEPAFLYGGYPFSKLRNKFLMATSSKAEDIATANLPDGMEIFPLDGHFWKMIGVKTPDDVYFLADCIFSAEIIEKYHVNFNYDIAAFFKTLDFVDSLDGKVFIPAHGNATEDIHDLVALNRKKAEEILQLLLEICNEPHSFDSLLQEVFNHYDLTMNHAQYVLVGSTIRSYLSYLFDASKIDAYAENNLMFWKSLQSENKN